MAIFGVKTGFYGRFAIDGGPNLEIYLCAISHLISWLHVYTNVLWSFMTSPVASL